MLLIILVDRMNLCFLKVIMLLAASSFCSGFSFDFMASEVFILPLTHYNFSLSSPGVTYRSSILNMPDLPSWLHYTYSSAVHSGFIYGAPPEGVSDVQLEVIATDRHTYNTSRRIYDINISHQSSKPNEVRFKITNMNIDELLVGNRWEKLRSILVEDLWPKSATDGVVTSLVPASHKGDKLPLRPEDKEGVYISFGSTASFSFALLELEMEVKSLWVHRPCPNYFKKASYERFFRQKGFAIDWCNFKLHSNQPGSSQPPNSERNAAIISTLENPPVKLIKRGDVISRSYIWDVIYTILIPLVVMLLLLALLTLAMCCHRTNMDIQSSIFFDELFDDFPRMPTIQDIQMVQYAGISKAVGAVRSVRGLADGRDHSPHPSMATTTTQVDTLPRSRTGSPSSTLPRNSTPSRRFEDYAALSRPDPPPYHRNGSTSSCLDT